MLLPEMSLIKMASILLSTFVLGMVFAPIWIRLLTKWKMGKTIRDAASAPIVAKLHAGKAGLPTMGGVVMWGVVTFVILGLAGLNQWMPQIFGSWNFLSRGQTWLPLAALVAAALVGLVDDFLNVKRIGPAGGGLRMRHRLISYSIIALVSALWFYTKLDWNSFHVPYLGTYELGWWYVPMFMLVLVATSNAVNITDGLDGLAGGPLMTAFGAYAIIAFVQGRVDLAMFCAAIVGALMAFLWFNVPPAKFMMGDTGTMSLGTALGIVAMLTNQPLLLIIIGLPFVVESLSSLIQMTSKKIRKKKVFLSAPLHHHLEASGWKESQIVMRFWLVSVCAGAIGVVMALTDRL